MVDAAKIKTNLSDPINALDGRTSDNGWLTSGVVGVTPAGATSGTGTSSVVAGSYRPHHGEVFVVIYVTFQSTRTVPSNGIMGGFYVAQMPAGYRPSGGSPAQGLGSGSGGPQVTYTIDSTGLIQLCSIDGGATLGVGTSLSITGSFLL
jgi:hypothetical protein